MAEFRHLSKECKATLHLLYDQIRNPPHRDPVTANNFRIQILDLLDDEKPELNISDGKVIVATDGSLKPHNGRTCAAGACVYTLQDSHYNRSAQIPVECTQVSILTAEITALLAAVKVAREHHFDNLLVVADSKGVVDKFNALKLAAYRPAGVNKIAVTELDKRLWTEIATSSRAINVRIRHIKSHQTKQHSQVMKLNKKADENAFNAMDQILQKAREDDGLALERR